MKKFSNVVHFSLSLLGVPDPTSWNVWHWEEGSPYTYYISLNVKNPKCEPSTGNSVYCRKTHVASFQNYLFLSSQRVPTGPKRRKIWVSQILTSWSMRTGGERLNFYERLLRGMPARLSKCRANKYGPCAKWPCAKNCAVQAFACRCKVTLPPCSVCGLVAMLWLTGTSWLMLQVGCGELTVLAKICANAQFESAELGCGIH